MFWKGDFFQYWIKKNVTHVHIYLLQSKPEFVCTLPHMCKCLSKLYPAQRELNDLQITRLSRRRMIWLLPHHLSRLFLSLLVRCWLSLLTGQGMGEEQNHTTARKPGALKIIQYSLTLPIQYMHGVPMQLKPKHTDPVTGGGGRGRGVAANG